MDARVVDKITGAWSALPWFMRLDTKTQRLVVNLDKASGIALNNTEYIIRVRSWIVLQPNASH